jgi:hypothetical protein
MKPTVVELFAHAADRAKDVAVMMDAARALTVLGRNRLGTDEAPRETPAARQVESLYHTAERLGDHVRQVSSEARTLLLAAKQMLQAEPGLQSQVPPDFDEVCQMMEDAMSRAVEAIERLEAMRLSAPPPAEEGATPPAEVLRAAGDLIDRLRRGSAGGG